MPGLIERIRRLVSPERAERGAEDDVIARAPEGTRRRLQALVQRRRQVEEERTFGNIRRERSRALREAEEGR